MPLLLQSLGLVAKPPHDVLRVRHPGHPACRAATRAGLLYFGAMFMAFDAVSSVAGPHYFPHLFLHCETAISCAGKVGAAMAGFAEILFGGLLRSVVAAALGYSVAEGEGR